MTGRRLVAKWAKLGLKARLLHALRVKLPEAGSVSAVPAHIGDKLSPPWAIAKISQTRSGLPKVRRL
jgi:hypothetical protein